MFCVTEKRWSPPNRKKLWELFVNEGDAIIGHIKTIVTGSMSHSLLCVVGDIESCLLSNNVNDYHFVAQGKTVIAGVDDGEEMTITDVSFTPKNRPQKIGFFWAFLDLQSSLLLGSSWLIFFSYCILSHILLNTDAAVYCRAPWFCNSWIKNVILHLNLIM